MSAITLTRGIILCAAMGGIMGTVGCARPPYSELSPARVQAAAQAVHPAMPHGLKPHAGADKPIIIMGRPPSGNPSP